MPPLIWRFFLFSGQKGLFAQKVVEVEIHMTDSERQIVLNLRKEGKGYKAIAKETGLNPQTIASFIKQFEKHICPQCHQTFPAPNGRRYKRFCSAECRIKYWSEHYKLAHRASAKKCICEECGSEFLNFKSVDRKFCSRICFQRHESRKWGKRQ